METRQERGYDYFCKILVIGPEKSGKGSLILRHAADTFTGSYLSNDLNSTIRTVQLDNCLVKNQMFEEIRGPYGYQKNFRGADAIVVTVDMTDVNALTNLQRDLQEIERFAKENVVVSIAATKIDEKQNIKVKKDDLIDFITQHNDLDTRQYGLGFVSSKTGEGVDALFKGVSKRVVAKINDDYVDINQEVKDLSKQENMKEILKQGREISATKEEMEALITRIQAISTNYGYWQGKVRSGFGAGLENQKVPANIANFLVILGNPNSSYQDTLKNIGKIADNAHSSYFQWAHSLFRGRDDTTNALYGILSKLSQDNGVVSKRVIDEITGELDKEFPNSSSSSIQKNAK